jgi:ribosome-associated protein
LRAAVSPERLSYQPLSRRDSALEDSHTPSKTQRKRDRLRLQALGEELIDLSADQLAQLQLPERLLDAVRHAQTIKRFGALRRQRQYIGRLMREVDSEAIAAKLAAWEGTSRSATAYLHTVERWRTRLLEDDTALAEFTTRYAGCDTQRLRQLIGNAKQEAQAGETPHSYRALFRALRDIIPEGDSNA